jgi:hypothetical protein
MSLAGLLANGYSPGGGGAVSSVNTKTGAVVLVASDIGAAPSTQAPGLSALTSPDASVTIGGTLTAPTLVTAGGGAVASVNGHTGVVVLAAADVGAASTAALATETTNRQNADALLAPLAAPALTGAATLNGNPLLTNPIAAPAFTALTLINSWITVAGGQAPRICVDALGFVHIEGSVTSGATAASPPFAIPAGFRPSTTRKYIAMDTGGASYVITIATTGTITISASVTSGNSLDFNQIYFP